MKTVRPRRKPSIGHGGVLFAAWAVLSGPLLAGASVPEDQAAAASQVVAPAAGPAVTNTAAGTHDKKPDKTRPSSVTTSFGVEEIQKMVAAGVSTEVIKTSIQNALVTRSLSPAELISLKEHGVPDEITTALLKRAAEIKAEARQARSGSVIRLGGDGETGSDYLDPDSYEFWWYHYAYPRVLSTSYQTLYPYRVEPYLYSYPYFGFGAPVPYGSYFSVRSPRLGFYGSARGFSGARPGLAGSRPLPSPLLRNQTARPLGYGGVPPARVR